MSHQREISGNGRLDLQGQGHDGEGHGATTLRGCSGHHGAEDHGDAHDVVRAEDWEVVVSDSQTPPDQMVEAERDEYGNVLAVLDQDPFMEGCIWIKIFDRINL